MSFSYPDVVDWVQNLVETWCVGMDYDRLRIVLGAIGPVFGAIVLLLALITRRAFFWGLFAFLLIVFGYIVPPIINDVLSRYQQCEDTKGTLTYMFGDNVPPSAETVLVRRCRTRHVGSQEWGAWGKPFTIDTIERKSNGTTMLQETVL